MEIIIVSSHNYSEDPGLLFAKHLVGQRASDVGAQWLVEALSFQIIISAAAASVVSQVSRGLYTLATPRRGKQVVSGWVEAID